METLPHGKQAAWNKHGNKNALTAGKQSQGKEKYKQTKYKPKTCVCQKFLGGTDCGNQNQPAGSRECQTD